MKIANNVPAPSSSEVPDKGDLSFKDYANFILLGPEPEEGWELEDSSKVNAA
jgi:hypothetical protein